MVGNRISKAHDAVGTGDDSTILSEYNDRDQLIQSGNDDDADGELDTGEIDSTYVYDPNGSTVLVEGPDGDKGYKWDLRNRMTGYDAGGDGTYTSNGDATFGYDHEDTRVSKEVVDGETTVYLQDKNNPTGYSQVLEEKPTANGTPTRSYLIGQSVQGQSDGVGAMWFVTDGHGSTRTLVKPDGTLTQGIDYDAYGNALGFDPASVGTSILYTNQLFDSIVDQYVLRARYYNQVIGSFSSFDFGFEGDSYAPATLHKYLYTPANPINFVDPSGNSFLGSMLTTIGTIARIGTGIGFGVSGAWNLANAGINVQKAYVASTSGSPSASLEIIGRMVLSIVETYAGISNIQVANALLFGAPNPIPIPPGGLAFLRAAMAAGGESPVLIGQAVIALSPTLAASIANAAGAFMAANAFFSTSFGGGSSTNPGRFASNSQLQDHFNRHGRDFGAKTATEYELQANSFLNGSRAPGVLEKVRANGDIVRYNPTTQEFGVARPDGTIRTYYRPNPAVHRYPTNLDYFNAQ